MRKNKHYRMRPRTYWGKINSGGKSMRLEAETFATVLVNFGGRVEGENLNDFGQYLWIAQLARLPLSPEMPKAGAHLHEWFEWEKKMQEAGQVVSLKDIAKLSCRAYETIKKEHGIYFSELSNNK